jgi:hypothetical protein
MFREIFSLVGMSKWSRLVENVDTFDETVG